MLLPVIIKNEGISTLKTLILDFRLTKKIAVIWVKIFEKKINNIRKRKKLCHNSKKVKTMNVNNTFILIIDILIIK